MTPEMAMSERRLCKECGTSYSLEEYGESAVATASALAAGSTGTRESVFQVNYIILSKCPKCYSLFLLKGMENYLGEGKAATSLGGGAVSFALSCFAMGVFAALVSGLALRVVLTIVSFISSSPAGSFLFLVAQSGLSFFLYIRFLRWRGIEWEAYRQYAWSSSTWFRKLSLFFGWCLALLGGVIVWFISLR